MKLSVIIPVYNVEKYLKQCLDSVVNQTYKDLEIILVNDGSPDNCGEICQEYANKDNRIVYIEKENGGLVSAYTTGYKYVTSEYVTFVDSDDYIDVEMYEQMLKKFDEFKDIDLVMCAYDKFDQQNNYVKVDLGISEGIQLTKDKQFFHKMNSHFISPARWNKIFRKFILDDIIYNMDSSVESIEDRLVVVPYFMKIEKFYYIDKTLYKYRCLTNSMSKRIDRRTCENISNGLYKLLKYDKDLQFTDEIYETILEAFWRILSIILGNIKIENIKENRKLFKYYIKSKAFKLVKKVDWQVFTKKQKLLKFMLKYCPIKLYDFYSIKYFCKK